jgi:hypothetical protein
VLTWIENDRGDGGGERTDFCNLLGHGRFLDCLKFTISCVFFTSLNPTFFICLHSEFWLSKVIYYHLSYLS